MCMLILVLSSTSSIDSGAKVLKEDCTMSWTAYFERQFSFFFIGVPFMALRSPILRDETPFNKDYSSIGAQTRNY